LSRRVAAVALTTGLLVAAVPSRAVAHGIGGRLDLPVPLSFFVVAAGLALVISFLALSALWPDPRLQDGPRHRRLGWSARWPAAVLGVLGVAALLLVVGQIVPPLVGLERVRGRPAIAPVLVFVVMWLVVPFASSVVGNWYAAINPWANLARWSGLGSGVDRPATPDLGVWPATFAFVAFAWFELISPDAGNVTALGLAALLYSFYVFLFIGWLGRDRGIVSADLFTTYNRVFSAISPLGRDQDGSLVWRGWLRSLPVMREWNGLATFILVAIGTVSYDGASGTAWFRNFTGDFGTTLAGQTLLLLGTVAAVVGAYWLASWTAARMVGETTASTVSRRFAHTLVPIALAYAVAHYATLIIFEGQQIVAAISDPFGLGWNVFGTADRTVDYFVTASEPIWYFQVVAIVVGHVLGVVLAHDRALADFGKNAVRSQYAMLLLMVGLTSLGLLILAG